MKSKSVVYDYLEKIGVLENGTADDIMVAKKSYWKLIRKEWRIKQRKECKSYTVFFNLKEQKNIAGVAKLKGVSITKFIKQSALYKANIGSGVDMIAIGKVREAFFVTYNSMEGNMSNENDRLQLEILNQLIELEKLVLNIIR
jgi:hypothetical protein